MKIAYLSTFYPFRGGIAQFNASLYRAFEENGHEIKAFTFTRQYPNLLFPGKSQYVTEKDKSDPIPSEAVLDTLNPVTFFSAATKIKKFKPDILLMKFWLPYFGPSLGTVAGKLKKHGTKVITILDNVIPHEKRPGDIAFTKYFLNRNSGFVVMSHSVKDDLLKLKPNAKYLFNPHPVYNHFGDKIDAQTAREKLNIPKDKKVLLFFGLVREYKGLDLLIKALNGLPDDYFLLVGGEVYGDEKVYLDLIKLYHLEDRVSVNFRYIDDQEVPMFFSAADVLVLPYKSATQSGIFSISLHFDLPTIVTDVGSLKELVEPKEIGLVVKKPDFQLIREKIEDYFSKDLKNNLASNISIFKKENSWENLAENIIHFADQL